MHVLARAGGTGDWVKIWTPCGAEVERKGFDR
jgi:hypothetical protein